MPQFEYFLFVFFESFIHYIGNVFLSKGHSHPTLAFDICHCVSILIGGRRVERTLGDGLALQLLNLLFDLGHGSYFVTDDELKQELAVTGEGFWEF